MHSFVLICVGVKPLSQIVEYHLLQEILHSQLHVVDLHRVAERLELLPPLLIHLLESFVRLDAVHSNVPAYLHMKGIDSGTALCKGAVYIEERPIIERIDVCCEFRRHPYTAGRILQARISYHDVVRNEARRITRRSQANLTKYYINFFRLKQCNFVNAKIIFRDEIHSKTRKESAPSEAGQNAPNYI